MKGDLRVHTHIYVAPDGIAAGVNNYIGPALTCVCTKGLLSLFSLFYTSLSCTVPVGDVVLLFVV